GSHAPVEEVAAPRMALKTPIRTAIESRRKTIATPKTSKKEIVATPAPTPAAAVAVEVEEVIIIEESVEERALVEDVAAPRMSLKTPIRQAIESRRKTIATPATNEKNLVPTPAPTPAVS